MDETRSNLCGIVATPYEASRLTCSFCSPYLPFFVVTRITPLDAREPYIARAEASFNTSIDSISPGFISIRLAPFVTPSTTTNGSLFPIVLTPRIRIFAFDPASPLVVTITPAIFPCIACAAENAPTRPILSPLTLATAPVRSTFFIVP